MTVKDYEVLKFNIPNWNNRIYTLEESNAVSQEGFVFSEPFLIDKIVGKYYNLVLKEEGIFCDIEFLDTPMGNIFKAINEESPDSIKFVTCGTGELYEDETKNFYVKKFELSGLIVTKSA